jgi:LysR family transcriptional regulator, nitrogen assimilation regulatory protein
MSAAAREMASRVPELRELRYFRSVARTGNFGRAARELNISQPTVSHWVHRLEEQVGRPLLVRHGHGVTLTPAGSSLLERLDVIMHLLALPLDETQASEALFSSPTLGISPEAAPIIISSLMERSAARRPGPSFAVVEAVSAKLEELLLSRRLDMAVLQDPPALESIRTEPILSDPLGLVVSARSALAQLTGPVHLRQLAELPLLLPDPMHSVHRKLESAGFQRGIRLKTLMHVDSPSVAKEMVRKDLGYAVLPSIAMQDELARGEMVFIPIDKPNLSVVHAFAYRDDATASHVMEFAKEIRAVMAERVRGWAWGGATLIASSTCASSVPEDRVMAAAAE